MKKLLLFIAPFLMLLVMTSCSKGVLVPNQNSIEGSWVLTEASQSDGFNWTYFNSGMEDGVFDFYRNGDAEYDDGFNRMRGQWRIRTLSNGYYDQYGRYQNNIHQTFEVDVYDSRTQGSINLIFDDIVVHPNTLIGTAYDGRYVIRYTFKRY